MQHLAGRQRAAHELELQRRVVELRVADVGAEENDTAIGRERLELRDAPGD